MKEEIMEIGAPSIYLLTKELFEYKQSLEESKE
jgi:hypothetical protein